MNGIKQYNWFSKLLHWVTALLIFGLLAIGFYMGQLDFSEDKLALYALHKSFGLLVLALVFIRVVWHIIYRKPKSLPTHSKVEKALSHSAHAFLYLALFAMPLSGWVMSSAGDFSIQFFGIDMPDIVEKNKDVFGISREAHEIIAFLLIGVVGLHILGALKHHFIDRDATLKRMTTMRLGVVGGIVFTLLIGVLFSPALYFVAEDVLKDIQHEEKVAEADLTDSSVETSSASSDIVPVAVDVEKKGEGNWKIVHDESAIAFTATQYNQPFEGKFGKFDGDINFNPDDLPNSSVSILIDISSISTGSDDRDTQARSAEWFDDSSFPQAKFESESFEYSGDDSYIVHGYLTIRDVRLPLDFPFTLKINSVGENEKVAEMNATFTLSRLNYGVGQGQWKETNAIGDNVDIEVGLVAKSVTP